MALRLLDVLGAAHAAHADNVDHDRQRLRYTMQNALQFVQQQCGSGSDRHRAHV